MSSDALAGYRVLDFGTAFASPMAANLLADMGAEAGRIYYLQWLPLP
jgi:crotonobetainyl-CoA:carnitine CoA-transferase CaiB-like acyl-CoA transferase